MTRLTLATAVVALTFLATPTLALGGSDRECVADPYADPANDTCNPLRYIPNKALNSLSAALYLIVAIALTYRHFRQRANYFMCLCIGAWFEGFGFILRLVFRSHPQSLNLYIVCNLFVILPPCAYLAADYILFGRLVAFLGASEHCRPLSPRVISWVFICSDVFTFLIQGSGGGLSASGNADSAKLGSKLFLIGLILQLVSFVIFTFLWVTFGLRVRKRDAALWTQSGWKPLYFAMGFTCICYIIRSFFRVIELAQGYDGYLATHEGYLLGLDVLPMFLGIATYVFFWPGAWLHFEKGWKYTAQPRTSAEDGLQMPAMGRTQEYGREYGYEGRGTDYKK
ncbi:hypothetical protein IAT38_004860 [Cryptococcus sp. DSM 104549]